jgi:hypothetical protein
LGSFDIFSLNRIVDLSSVNWNARWGVNSQSNFVTSNIYNCDDNVVTDHDALVAMSRQNQHLWLLPFFQVAGATISVAESVSMAWTFVRCG